MTDARVPRRAQVVLLDDRTLDFLVQPRLLSRELLDMVASHFNLHEKEYFGLYHTDDTGNENWLSLDRKVLDHDLPRYADPIVFHFAVRFYVPSITYFREKVTVELFYLQAKALIFKGNIHCESDVVFHLGGYVLQATFGDFTNENAARNDIKKVPILPTRTLTEHPSITYCEDKVIGHYRKLEKMGKGQSIVEYLNKFRSIPTYGVHYYEVKDKQNIPWWMGMSPKGVGVYDYSDKTKPRKVYKWHQIENLYFRERKFSIEIKNLRKISEVSLDGGRQRSNSLGRRTNGQNRVLIHAWYASTTAQAKAMWTMAISQHQFYLKKRDQEEKLTTPRTLEDIANELSRSSGSLNSSMASVMSDSSEPSESGQSSNGGENGQTTENARKEMIAALAARKDALEMRLKEKIEVLRQICFREAAITGKYPPETPYNPNCSPPPVRKRVGTAFTFSDILVKNNAEEERDEKVHNLEIELEIQSKITDAAEKLAKDTKASKNVRKSRRLIYQESFSKLKMMQQVLKQMKDMQNEDHGIDGTSLNSFEDDIDGIKPPSSRRSSFEAATGQGRASDASSTDSNTIQSMPKANKPVATGSTSSNEELANQFDLTRFNETPEFASSTMINAMLARKRPNVTSHNSSSGFHRLDSNSSVSSSSSLQDRLRPPPPSYSESRFSRRESSSLGQEKRRDSVSLTHQNHSDREVHKPQTLSNHLILSGLTKVRYVGGGSPSQSDSDYNSDDVQITNSPTSLKPSAYDKKTERWISTSPRGRSNMVTARYNYPSKIGIMSNSESTGSYFVTDNLTRSNVGHIDKTHLYVSTSALNQVQLVSDTLPRSHHSSYSIHTPLQKRQPLMNRFFKDGRSDWSGEEPNVESLV